MRKNLLVLLIPTLLACNNTTTETSPTNSAKESQEIKRLPIDDALVDSDVVLDLQQFKLAADADLDYSALKKSIASRKVDLLSSNSSIDSLQSVFEESLLNRIIPFWEGTSWSFEGHTSKPKTGSIACGYFVSTTLQDSGVKINRYKLAQQSPINEAKSLALQSEVIEIAEVSTVENMRAISERVPDGIHFIGFDQSHVGYLLKEHNEMYLIHSNYVEIRGVEIEKVEESSVFSSYSRLYIVKLSTNPDFLNAWLNGYRINIVSE